MPDNLPPTFVTLARLLRPQGRKGELLCDLLTELPEQLTSSSGVYLVSPSAEAPATGDPRASIESFWHPTGRNAGRVVIKLTGCDSISAAEQLAGSRLMIPAAERPPLGSGTFYVSDLIGCRVFDRGRAAGMVTDVEFATTPDGKVRLDEAAPLLCVQPDDAATDTQPLLIPFVLAYLEEVDIASQVIRMNLPEGLLP